MLSPPRPRTHAPTDSLAGAPTEWPAVPALVHDYLNQHGGAERVLSALCRLFPTAPVYTSIYDRARMVDYHQVSVRTSFMQRLPGVTRHHQAYLPLYPLAFERLDLRDHDLIISSSSAWAKAARPPVGVPHLCYCHAPMRFAWSYRDYIQGEAVPRLAGSALRPAMALLRRYDVATARRVTRFIANSRAVAARIARCYGREAVVIHPPVDTARFRIAAKAGDSFLIAQRLAPYKRLDLAIDAFNQLGLPLTIVGDGRARADLERRAGPTIQFAGRLSDDALAEAFARCRAYIVPGEEDFAIAPVEAQAAGRPVIAYGAGGVLDTVVPGQTGIFFDEQTPAALARAVRAFETMTVNPAAIRTHALQFDTAVFERRIWDEVQRLRPSPEAPGCR